MVRKEKSVARFGQCSMPTYVYLRRAEQHIGEEGIIDRIQGSDSPPSHFNPLLVKVLYAQAYRMGYLDPT
jgi:hypothetical protein